MIKKIFTKRNIATFVTTLVLIAILVSIYFIDLAKFNSRLEDYNEKYLLKVTYLIADRDKLDDGITLGDVIQNHDDEIFYTVDQIVPLKKDGDYLYADMKKFANKLVFDHVTDVSFANNNVFGEVLSDCEYDKKTHIVKIPYEHYKNEAEAIDEGNVQAEIVTLLTDNEINNIETNYSVKKLVTYDASTSNELYELQTSIPLSKYINATVAKESIKLYVNGSKIPADPDTYGYASDAKTLVIYVPAILINRVDIKVGNNIFTNVFAAKKYSLSSIKNSSGFKLKSRPDYLIKTGHYHTKTYTVDDAKFDKNGLTACWSSGKLTDKSKKKKVCVSSNGQGSTGNSSISVFRFSLVYEKVGSSYYKGSSPYHAVWPFIIRSTALGKNQSGDVIMDFTSTGSYIPIVCADHTTKSGGGKLAITVKTVSNQSSKNYLVVKAYTSNSKEQARSSGSQYGLVYFKVYWENTECSMTVDKSIQTTSDTSGAGVATFDLYNNSTCTGTPLQTKTLNINLANGSTGSVTFTNLKTNNTLYYIKESSFIDANGNNLLGTEFIPSIDGDASNCHPFTPKDTDSNKVCDNPFTVKNNENKYCYSIKKVDKENTNTVVNNTTWKLTGIDGSEYTATATNGIAVFTNLKYQDYKLKETTANPADLDGDGILDYWNDHHTDAPEDTVLASSLTLGDECNNPVNKADTKVYYCIKVKKVDATTREPLRDAEFTAVKGNITIDKDSNNYHTDNATGVTSFFIGDSSKAGDYTITETKAPEGYTVSASRVVSAVPLAEATNEAAARTACFSDSAKSIDGITSIADKTYNRVTSYVFEDYKYLINWYKTTENGSTLIDEAEFKVKDSSGKYLVVSAPEVEKDTLNVEKACYQYTGTNTTGTVMISGANGSTNINMTGQVCIGALPPGTYTVVETKAPQYHTFGSTSTKDILATTTFANINSNNKIINQPTEFKFKKRVSDTDGSQEGNVRYTITRNGVTKTVSLSEMTTAELQKITFTVYDSNGNPVSVKEISSGHYEYGGNSVDQVGTSENTTELHLDANREIYIKHLPKGDYTIKEVDTSSCALENGGAGTTPNPTTRPSTAATCANGGSGNGECIGYYMPNYSSNTYSFTIDDCSSELASQNDKACTSEAGIVIKELTNIPTEIIFTKKDLYGYGDQADIIDNDREQNSTESTVEFENAKERSDFDRIDFKVKDSSGRYLNFVYVGNSSDTCTSDSDYSIYKYIPGLELPTGVNPDVFNYHPNIGGLTVTQTLHACGGHIKLVNLCRGETYTFEEIRVPDDSVYVLEQVGALNPEVCFEIPCTTDADEQRTSTTAVINDKPTRVTFEKRDGKYNYLIPDETTTFEVYRCPKDNGENTYCSPSSYSTVEEREAVGMKLIKFEPRAVIAGDEEDSGLEVYRMMSDSDAESKTLCTDSQSTNCYVTSVHPVSGKLVLRYLQSGYNYVLLETVAPKNYILPKGKVRETSFTVVNTTVAVDQIEVPNSPSAIIIKKYADLDGDGEADSAKYIGGAKFKVYKVTNYNANQKPQDQEKELIQLKTIKDGVYENRPVLDTEIVTTCSGDNCSYIPMTLGYNASSLDDIDELIDRSNPDVTKMLEPGTAIIQYLEYNTYYVIEEVEAPQGYSLPENDDDRFTIVHVRQNEDAIVDTGMSLVNKPSSFTFYKFDEFNSPLDGATFYLQKLDQTKKYNTLTVSTEDLITGETIYKADPTSELKEIHTVGGKATVYYLEPGQYRILEVEAAEGYELPKKTINVATFFVDEDGLVYGNNIITNKKPQETIEYLAEAKSELIISIQTGKTVVKYGLLITLLIGSIVGLIILLKKRK